MSISEFGLLLVAVGFSTLGQLLLKLGALKLGAVTAGNAISLVVSIVTIPQLVGGLLAYGMGAIAYILALTRINLSIAAPSASLIYVFTVLMGYFVFHEPISLGRILGMGLVVCGVILIATR